MWIKIQRPCTTNDEFINSSDISRITAIGPLEGGTSPSIHATTEGNKSIGYLYTPNLFEELGAEQRYAKQVSLVKKAMAYIEHCFKTNEPICDLTGSLTIPADNPL